MINQTGVSDGVRFWLDKIKVTEGQAEIIERVKKSYFKQIEQVDSMLYHTDLDLITIARIVEGEPYEVECEFKVGDILLNTKSKVVFEVTQTILDRGIIFERDVFKVVCKAENREDM